MGRSTRAAQARGHRFGTSVGTRFTTPYAGPQDFWATPPAGPARGGRPGRVRRLGSTVLPRLDLRPWHYALHWQVFLWVTAVVLFVSFVLN